MTRTLVTVLAVAFSLFVVTAGLIHAHHSTAAMYNLSKPITFKGTVTEIEWTNPHIYYYVEVKSERGGVVRYAVEGGARTLLLQHGWTQHSLKPGDMVTVSGYRAKDGSNHITGRSVTLPDGKPVFTGTAPGVHLNP